MLTLYIPWIVYLSCMSLKSLFPGTVQPSVLCLLKAGQSHYVLIVNMLASLPLSHQWDVDTVSSGYSSKRNKPSNQGRDVLQQERGGIKTGGEKLIIWLCCTLSDQWKSCLRFCTRSLFYHKSGCITQSYYKAGRTTC